VIPCQFLTPQTRAILAERWERRPRNNGDIIIRKGDRSRELFLLASGQVEFLNPEQVHMLSSIEPGHYFGERAALFDSPRQVTARARGDVVVYTLPALDFLNLIDEHPVFAQALATSLTIKQGIFLSYRRLWARILSLVNQGGLLLSSLIKDYEMLHPALHPHLHEQKLDLGALSYAANRLPEGVTETAFYYLTTHLPPLYAEPDTKFQPVRTRARRRAAWRPIPGKCIVLLRDGMSDITDLLTCLCAYAVEARKIRRRVRSPELLAALGAHLRGQPSAPIETMESLCRLSNEELERLRDLRGAEHMWLRR